MQLLRIITKESINMDIAYYKSRYDKGSADYINCPFTEEQFDYFYQELINGKRQKDTVLIKRYSFEGCMPIEVMAKEADRH